MHNSHHSLQDSLIRLATVEDIPQMIPLAERFFAASGLSQWFRFDPESFANTVDGLIGSPAGIVLIAKAGDECVGMVAALAYQCWFDSAHRTAQELFWWVEPEHRQGSTGAQLWRRLEEWAQQNECRTMEMGALEALRPEALGKKYARLGYGPKERIFVKSLL